MEDLPSDTLNIICSYLPISSKAMLAFTCKAFTYCKPKIQSLLSHCIQENEYKFVQYLSTCTEWNDGAYWSLGAFGNTALLNLRVNMTQEQLLHLAKGIVANGNTKLLAFLCRQCRHPTLIPMIVKEAVLTERTDLLSFAVYQNDGIEITATKIAVNLKDEELLRFCYKHNADEVRQHYRNAHYSRKWMLEALGLRSL